jgi:hypothetical protein
MPVRGELFTLNKAGQLAWCRRGGLSLRRLNTEMRRHVRVKSLLLLKFATPRGVTEKNFVYVDQLIHPKNSCEMNLTFP